jgi:hypothetical protein
MSNKSRRRVAVAAGAMLASAAILIAEADTPAADEASGGGAGPNSAVSVDGKTIVQEHVVPAESGATVNDDPYVYDNWQSLEAEETT